MHSSDELETRNYYLVILSSHSLLFYFNKVIAETNFNTEKYVLKHFLSHPVEATELILDLSDTVISLLLQHAVRLRTECFPKVQRVVMCVPPQCSSWQVAEAQSLES